MNTNKTLTNPQPINECRPLNSTQSKFRSAVANKRARDPLFIIAIPTFRRPNSLRRTLDSIAELHSTYNFRVLVADNDAKLKQGQRMVQEIREQYPWPIDTIVVDQRGISNARNALMETAFADPNTSAVVMLDDDQWVEPNWLDELVIMQEKTQADIVGNRVLADFQTRAPKWAKGLYVYGLPAQADGPCEIVEGSCGILISRSIQSIGREPPIFDPYYGVIGGGDSEFFARTKAQGALFAFASHAISHEVIDEQRLNRRWAMRRAFRIGGGDMRIKFKYSTGLFQRLKEIIKAIAAICASPLLMLRHCMVPRKSMNAMLLLCRNVGKLTAIFQFQLKEYQTTIGD